MSKAKTAAELQAIANAATAQAEKAAQAKADAQTAQAAKDAAIAQAAADGIAAEASEPIAEAAPAQAKEIHFKTSDGNVFYTKNNAVYHALKLQDKEIVEVEA